MAELRFDGKVAIVTGGGRGSGGRTSRHSPARGCQVLVNDPGVATHGVATDETAADDAAEEIRSDGGIAVADRNSVIGDGAAVIVEHALDEFGRVDIVVNNAGISGGGAFDEMPVDVLRPARRHALRRRGAREPRRVAAPQGVGRGSHREHVVGVGVRHAVHQSLRVEQGWDLRVDARARRRRSVLGHQRQLGDAAAFTRMTAQLPDDDGFRTFLETYFPPDKVAPFVAFLAHESTTISGETFSVGADRAARVFLAECPGVQGDGTPESFAAQADDAAVDRGLGDPVGHDGRGALLLRPPRARDPGRVRRGRGAARLVSDFDAVLWDYGGIFTASPFAAAHTYAALAGRRPRAHGRDRVRCLRLRHRPRVAPARAR